MYTIPAAISSTQALIPCQPQKISMANPYIIDSLSISAAKRASVDGIDIKDRQSIRGYIDNCRYGVNFDTLLEPGNNFRASYDGHQVTLHHFNLIEKSPRFNTCGNLAPNCAKALQSLFGDKYFIRIAMGSEPCYFGTTLNGHKSAGKHYFVLLWPVKDNDAMQRRLAVSPIHLPKECLVVDPSFKAMGTQEELQYKITETIPVDSKLDEDLGIPFAGTPCDYPGREGHFTNTGYYPLGLAEDVLNVQGINAKTMLYLTFIRNEDKPLSKPEPLICVQSPNTGMIDGWADWASYISPGSSLGRFMGTLQNQLSQ